MSALRGAEALALACTLDAAAAADATREIIEPLMQAADDAVRMVARGRPVGPSVRADRELFHAQEAAIKSVRRATGWRFAGINCNLDEVHRDFKKKWCENCGGLCVGGRYGGHGPKNEYAQRDAFRYHRGPRGLADAIILHTRHPFEACQRYADLTGLRVIQLAYSWHGKPTAALFERNVK